MPVDTKRVPITQVAAELGIPRGAIEHWLRRGELDSIRFGPRRIHLVRPADVRALATGTSPTGQGCGGQLVTGQ